MGLIFFRKKIQLKNDESLTLDCFSEFSHCYTTKVASYNDDTGGVEKDFFCISTVNYLILKRF